MKQLKPNYPVSNRYGDEDRPAARNTLVSNKSYTTTWSFWIKVDSLPRPRHRQNRFLYGLMVFLWWIANIVWKVVAFALMVVAMVPLAITIFVKARKLEKRDGFH